MSFKDLGLSEQTIQAITDLGYTEPTAVQKDVIPSVLEGKDIFIIAPSGCGKTCSYIFPLIDIISKKEGQTILVISADTKESVNISDKFAIFNKYHEVNEATIKNDDIETNPTEANVIIASPDLLLDNINENRIDISNVNILVVDDINLIKKKRQLKNLDKILELLPTNKQNIVFTTRRSKETQDTLDKILKTPAEIKVNKDTDSVVKNEPTLPILEKACKKAPISTSTPINKKSKAFGYKIPAFLLTECQLADEQES